MNRKSEHIQVDFQRAFESSPNLYLLLSPNLTIIGASDAYLQATLTRQNEIIGRGLFDVFPDNPNDPNADGVSNLLASLNVVRDSKQAHTMPVQKYDIRTPDGAFEERYWSPLNTPVLDDKNELLYIIHRVEDVTELIRTKKELEQKGKESAEKIKQSEERFHKIFNLCPVAIYMTDVTNGKCMYVNKAFEMLFLMKSEDIIGKTFVELNITDEQDRSAVVQQINAKGGRAVELETSLRISNGAIKNMLLSTEVIEMDNRKCFLVAMVDISERKKMENEIRELNTELENRVAERTEEIVRREKKFRALVEKNVDMMTLTAEDGTLLYVSPSVSSILGHSVDDYVNGKGFDFIHPDDIPGLVTKIAAIINAPGKSFHRQQRLLHKDGSYRWCEGTVTNMLNDPDIGALISNFRDITDRKAVEDAIKNAEANYREIFDKASDAIYVHHINTGQIIEVNQKACEITGFTKEEIINGSLNDFVTDNPEYSIQHAASYLQKAGMGSPQLFEWLGKKKNGASMWLEVNLKKATIAGEERILAFFRKINDRKKKEEEIKELNQTLEKKVFERTEQLEQKIGQLQESEEKFQKAFQASAAGITITRLTDSVYLDVNDAFTEMTGFSKEEIINHTSKELGLIVDLNRREEVLEQIRTQGVAKHIEMTIRTRTGNILDVLSSVDTILFNGEKYAINIIYDITERKKAEQELKAVNKELEAFTYSVSHDLRAPLRAITGFARILEEDYAKTLDDEGKRLLGTISGNAEKMGRLIDDLLTFSRLGRKELQKTDTDMSELIKNAISDIGKTISLNNTVINTASLLNVRSDAALLKQVLLNLISNALKYSSRKENPVIEISSEQVGNEVVYCVKDNGVGFDMRYANKLFGVFQRLHSEKDFTGTGVGLAIVQRIIHKHGGRVWAEGKVNEGAAFFFSIPLN